MADEETPKATDETEAEETPSAEETPVAEETPAAEETPVAETPEGGQPEAAEQQEATAEDSGAADGGPDEAPAEDTPAEEPAAPDEFEGIDWKARRRIVRSRESGEAGPQRSPEERAGARASRRDASAKARSAYRQKRRQGGEADAQRAGTPPADGRSAGRKERRGTVVSSKADKTITVRIDVARRHPAYEKIVRQSSTLHAHDETNEAGEGDLVRIIETRPLSRTKRWRLVEILDKAK